MGREFERVFYYPSPDLSAVLFSGEGSNLATRHWYLSLIDLVDVTHVGIGYLVTIWAPDSSRILVMQNESMYLYTKDGRSRVQIGIRSAYDGIPSWSPDSKSLYWTRRGELRVIDAVTGKSKPLEVGWQGDWLQVFQFAFSPSGQQVAFQPNGASEGRKLYLAGSEFSDPVAIPLDREDGLYSYVSGLYWQPAANAILVLMGISDPNCTHDCTESREYYRLDPTSLEMTRLRSLELAMETTVGRAWPCGVTPDGRNSLTTYNGTGYFFDLISGEITLQLNGPVTCPLWLQDE